MKSQKQVTATKKNLRIKIKIRKMRKKSMTFRLTRNTSELLGTWTQEMIG